MSANLSRVATWGDEIKSNASYNWARSLHYIDAHDAPPRRCGIVSSDCAPEGCLVSAIQNYTTRAINQKGNEQAEALRFLVHFVGDMHQPLHACGRDRGGTRAMAKYFGRIVNMHSVWDSMLFTTRIHDDFQGNKDLYGLHLVEQLKSTWASEAQVWKTCQVPEEDPNGVQSCPDAWVKVSNQVNCDFVWPLYKRRRELGIGNFCVFD